MTKKAKQGNHVPFIVVWGVTSVTTQRHKTNS